MLVETMGRRKIKVSESGLSRTLRLDLNCDSLEVKSWRVDRMFKITSFSGVNSLRSEDSVWKDV